MALSDADVQKQIKHMMAFIEQVTSFPSCISQHFPGRDFLLFYLLLFRKPMRRLRKLMPRQRKNSTSRKVERRG
jgi:hypothetical protein